MRTTLRSGLVFLAIFVSIMSFVNVFSDDAERHDAAMKYGCTVGKQCAMSVARTPFGETFTMESAAGTKRLSCSRAFLLVGEWSCSRE